MKDITVEIVVRKTYNLEVDDDFDFEDDQYEYISDVEADEAPDYEDWDSVTITDDEEGREYTY